ncbi:MAG TPA: aa3-type cytochrome c oxidase subunit IV, partial [Afifellaceae bacterium]|nr:aa3-type cytochrome c oxidase subunit IV [Afifellaceae bacterium]
MAEPAAPGPVETGAPMDYSEHEKTYRGFLQFTKLTIIATINILVTLA